MKHLLCVRFLISSPFFHHGTQTSLHRMLNLPFNLWPDQYVLNISGGHSMWLQTIRWHWSSASSPSTGLNMFNQSAISPGCIWKYLPSGSSRFCPKPFHALRWCVTSAPTSLVMGQPLLPPLPWFGKRDEMGSVEVKWWLGESLTFSPPWCSVSLFFSNPKGSNRWSERCPAANLFFEVNCPT